MRITQLGRTLAQIPLAPQFAKMLVFSNRDGLIPYMTTLVAALSVREPLIPVLSLREDTVKMAELLKQRQLWCKIGQAEYFGDLTVLLSTICVADHEEVIYNFLKIFFILIINFSNFV